MYPVKDLGFSKGGFWFYRMLLKNNNKKTVIVLCDCALSQSTITEHYSVTFVLTGSILKLMCYGYYETFCCSEEFAWQCPGCYHV